MQVLWIGIGSGVGAVVLTVLTVAFHWLFFRSAIGDGQYGLVFFVTVAAGTGLGAVTGRAFYLWWRLGLETVAARMCVVGGGVLGVLFLWLGWLILSGTENPTMWERARSVVFWFGPALAWAGGLVVAGVRLLSSR